MAKNYPKDLTLALPFVTLAFGAAILLASNLAFAQDTNAPTQLKRTVVTGSMIPTAETVGPAPVETLTATQIEQTGSQDVLELVKRISTAFAGNNNVGKELNNGGFGEANVQIHNLPTLVMLNGRRLAKSSFSNGDFVDLNTIPVGMIEKIEILKDGASALYGSEAIGGVVNIITKKDFNGTEISGRYGFATGPGTYTEQSASLVSGFANEKGSLMASASFFHNDELFSPDRHLTALSNEELARLGIAPSSYVSPSFPGKVQSGDGNGDVFLLANSPFLAGQPGYNPNLLGGPNGTTHGSPPIVPGGPFTGPNAVANYNAAAIANGYVDPTGNHLGPYVPFNSDPHLNTPLFGTATIQSQDRRQAFASGSYDLSGKEVQLFGQFLFANTESIGALAPSPVISLGPFDSNINVPSNNIYNPFGTALGPNGSSSPRVRSRFIESGNRIFDSQTDFYHFVAGLKGELDGGYTYNGAYTYNRSDQIQFTRNAINGAALDLALQPNSDPALAAQGFSQLRGPNGFVPQYNIFSSPTAAYPTRSGANSRDTIDAISTTLYQVGRAEEWGADGVITGEPLNLPGGKLGFAVGGGFRSESLDVDFDGLTRIGKVPGLLAAQPTSGRRDSWAGFAEVSIPITSPDMGIPGFRSLEVRAAGRYEVFYPGGDSAVPKVTLRWQPLDEQVTLRGTYSQSFVAPTTFQLFGGAAQNSPTLGFPDGDSIQATTLNVSNSKLHPVDSETYTAGIVISPKIIPGLTVNVDYFHTKVTDDIFRLSEQAMLNDLEVHGSASPYASSFHFDDGTQLTSAAANQITTANYGSMNVPYANGARKEIEGLDLGATYSLPLDPDRWGKVSVFANATVTFNFLYSDPVIGGPYHYEGQYTDVNNGIGGAQGLIPDWQIATGFIWEFRNLSYSMTARYIPEVTDLGDLHPAGGSTVNDFTLNGKPWTIESWYSIDVQLAYEIGKHKTQKAWYDGTRFAIGVNNVTDEKPPIIASSSEDNTDKSTYDIIGRFIYFQISKKF